MFTDFIFYQKIVLIIVLYVKIVQAILERIFFIYIMKFIFVRELYLLYKLPS